MRDNKSAPVVKKHFNIAELFESLNSVSGESQDIHTTQKINNAPATAVSYTHLDVYKRQI